MQKLNKVINWLVPPGPADRVVRIMFAWRLWLLGAWTGVLVSGLVYAVYQPDYQAQAIVVVDYNTEEAWQYYPDRQLFYFLDREARKLEHIAYSDEVIQRVSEEVGDVTEEDLRMGILTISHPMDGGWYLTAYDSDKQRAQELVSSWANVFVDQAKNSVVISEELETARAALRDLLAEEGEPEESQIYSLLTQIDDLTEMSAGISPYLEISVSQSDGLIVKRRVSIGAYYLLGSLIGVVSILLAALFVMKANAEEMVNA